MGGDQKVHLHVVSPGNAGRIYRDSHHDDGQWPRYFRIAIYIALNELLIAINAFRVEIHIKRIDTKIVGLWFMLMSTYLSESEGCYLNLFKCESGKTLVL